mmetsp:Transcript_8202/g.26970  ORF Transcript_8202/g.26970 Transcript_8202/m.26970 type:complete len:397 (+) Transcript_8202:1275-2465(+)
MRYIMKCALLSPRASSSFQSPTMRSVDIISTPPPSSAIVRCSSRMSSEKSFPTLRKRLESRTVRGTSARFTGGGSAFSSEMLRDALRSIILSALWLPLDWVELISSPSAPSTSDVRSCCDLATCPLANSRYRTRSRLNLVFSAIDLMLGALTLWLWRRLWRTFLATSSSSWPRSGVRNWPLAISLSSLTALSRGESRSMVATSRIDRSSFSSVRFRRATKSAAVARAIAIAPITAEVMMREFSVLFPLLLQRLLTGSYPEPHTEASAAHSVTVVPLGHSKVNSTALRYTTPWMLTHTVIRAGGSYDRGAPTMEKEAVLLGRRRAPVAGPGAAGVEGLSTDIPRKLPGPPEALGCPIEAPEKAEVAASESKSMSRFPSSSIANVSRSDGDMMSTCIS